MIFWEDRRIEVRYVWRLRYGDLPEKVEVLAGVNVDNSMILWRSEPDKDWQTAYRGDFFWTEAKAREHVQIRTLLQHTWAEIEHDLGYNTPQAIPARVRRQFSMLAGLLELADEEFERIRDDLHVYQGEIQQRLTTEPAALPIDQESLTRFIASSDLVQQIDRQIAEPRDAVLKLLPTYIGRRSAGLKALGVETIGQLDQELHRHQSLVPRAADSWFRGRTYPQLSSGLSVYFLALILLAELGCPPDIAEKLGLDEAHRRRLEKLHRDLAGPDAAGLA